MKNLLLIVMFASTTVSAREFSFDPDAMGEIAAGARALKVKRAGRPRPPLVSDYEARHLGFKLITDGAGRADGVVYVNRSIEIRYLGALLATLYVSDDVRGRADAERVLRAFESLRQGALERKRRVVIDYDAIERQNKAGAWSGKNPRECELFDELIRISGQ